MSGLPNSAGGHLHPDVDPHSNHTYIHTGIMCRRLDHFANVAIATITVQVGVGSLRGVA